MSAFDAFKDDSSYEAFGKRFHEHERLLNSFVRLYKKYENVDVELINDAAYELTVYYYHILRRDVWPYVPKKVNRYKIASILELVIMDLQPIYVLDPVARRKINSHFAYHAAVGAIASFKPNGIAAITHDGYTDKFLVAIKQQHVEWLYGKKRTDFPIFSNGLFLAVLHTMEGSSFPSVN